MSDGVDAAVAVHEDNSSGCGGDAPVPPCGDASGGVAALAEHVEAMDVDAPENHAHPHDDAMRAPLDNLTNATVDCCGTRSSKVPAHEAAVPDVVSASPSEPQPPPTASELKERARRMFVDGQSGLTGSGAAAAVTEARSATLTLLHTTRRPRASISAATLAIAASLRSQMAISMPSSANERQMAAPIPDAPPVTTATLV